MLLRPTMIATRAIGTERIGYRDGDNRLPLISGRHAARRCAVALIVMPLLSMFCTSSGASGVQTWRRCAAPSSLIQRAWLPCKACGSPSGWPEQQQQDRDHLEMACGRITSHCMDPSRTSRSLQQSGLGCRSL
ncbi:unnamed protein product [Prorocentrum cordatum]|uniref:Uncharacterized protein n=1 Tax=Prorocentrum cordatum TaxID=2364126 RepID=A0ABN9X5R8_9DINO|nr:unnamed protein product [Polarella glacialis]